MNPQPTTDCLSPGPHQAIARALALHARDVAPDGCARWIVRFDGDARLHARAFAAPDGWFDLHSAGPRGLDASPAVPWLDLNAGLPPGSAVEFAAPGDTPLLHSAAPLDITRSLIGDEAIAAVVADLCASHRHAWKLASKPASDSAPRPTTVDRGIDRDADAPAGDAMADLCAELGWRHIRRPGHPLAVQLECTGPVQYAELCADPAGDRILARLFVSGEHEWVEIEHEQCREALALLLLRTSGAFRPSLRAVLATDGAGRRTAALEACLPADAGSEALHGALCALSTAADLCTGEGAALAQDPALAGIYLEQTRTGCAPRAVNRF